MRNLLIPTVALVTLCGACQQPAPRLNAPPHGLAVNTSELQDTFEHMSDNALLENMTISDVHFVPHRAMLNSLGEERLCRLAGLLELYGGTIRFDTGLTDEDLIGQRADAITAFLAEEGIDTTKEVLVNDLPGGRGMDAPQAILIKANEATYKPKKQAGPGLFDRGN